MRDLLHIPAAELAALGIVEWGYTSETKPRSFDRFSAWLPANGAALPFLLPEKNSAYRSDVKVWWPEARSALVFLFSYAPAKKVLLTEGQHKVAGYALGFDGKDYHPILKERLGTVAKRLQGQIPLQWKHTHDTEPVLERDLAHRAGLGWFGKNAMLIHRQQGSYFMIGSLILDRELPLPPAEVSADHCGSCRACVDACPTAAIDPETRTLKASACLSAWTIEERDAATPAPAGTDKSRGEVFGCDICQDVCPWNQKPLERVEGVLGEGARRWLKWFHREPGEVAGDVAWMTNRGFLRFLEGTPFGRPGRPALLRTLAFWMKR